MIIMIVKSVFMGLCFGLLWGMVFSGKTKEIQAGGSSSWFLASTSTIRYLLLAAILLILMLKYKIHIAWWFVGFVSSFWPVLFLSTKSNNEKKVER